MTANHTTNALGQAIGLPVTDFRAPLRPGRTPLEGRFCRLEPLSAERHAAALFTANALDTSGRVWTYLPYGPFPSLDEYRAWVEPASRSDDPLFFAIVESMTGLAAGIASYLRIDPGVGSIEVGHIALSPRLQRTAAATEMVFLMMRWAFTAGYRRFEWKCDALNAPSRRAAQRFGLSFEGVFRQATIVKGRNRDTAWYATIDREWPALESAYTRWLDPANFGPGGEQRVSLASLTAGLLVARG